jgi:hypothetical protein
MNILNRNGKSLPTTAISLITKRRLCKFSFIFCNENRMYFVTSEGKHKNSFVVLVDVKLA